MDIVFILVNPAVYENIGFSLRAMKTMGFSEMRIIGEFDRERDEVRKTAYASHDLLQNVKVFSSLEEALADVDLAVGTTSKERTSRKDVIDSSDLSSALESKKGSIYRVAIVFGSEENGLTKEEINQCQLVSTVPQAIGYPSLNLAQGVMVYAYELSRLSGSGEERKSSDSLFKTMLEEGREIIQWLELDKNPVLYRRMMDRLSMATDADIHMILSSFKKIRRKMTQKDSSEAN